MTVLAIDDATAADMDALLRLNNRCVPQVNELTTAELERLLGQAVLGLAARVDGALAGALVVLGPGVDYASPNYRWFSERYDAFLYVDRVMVDETRRGFGIGRHLYQRLFRFARSRSERVLCEVNLEPPNPASLAFHRKLGFREVGRLHHESADKTVVMLERPVMTIAPRHA